MDVGDRAAVAEALTAATERANQQGRRAHSGDLAEGVLTSSWLAAHDDRVRAEALGEAAEDVGPALQNEVGGHTSTYSVRKWLLARAAAGSVRAGEGA